MTLNDARQRSSGARDAALPPGVRRMTAILTLDVHRNTARCGDYVKEFKKARHLIAMAEGSRGRSHGQATVCRDQRCLMLTRSLWLDLET